MKTLNRTKPIQLKWNEGAGIRTNVEHILDKSDPCTKVLSLFAGFMTEVRFIRNHVAHRNDGTRANFKKLVKKYYGAAAPGVTSGTLLLSERVSKPPLVEAHIRTARVLMKDLVRA